jgi:hypothetical protein
MKNLVEWGEHPFESTSAYIWYGYIRYMSMEVIEVASWAMTDHGS